MKENSINDVVAEVSGTMQILAEGKGLTLVPRMDDRMPSIQCDRDKIVQVVTNILGNAIKFTEHGSITVTTASEEGQGHVVIQDTGPGIPPEDLPRLFTAFERFATAKAMAEKGTGLGLAISKEIIAQHGGSIWAESKPGGGTAFHFTLPV